MTDAGADELYPQLRDYVGAATGAPFTARDPVNQPMIRHWCDAMGDTNPVYTDPDAARRSVHGTVVAPPTMLQAWNMRGLVRDTTEQGAQTRLMGLLDRAGFSSVVATDCEQEYHRYLVPGDVLTETGTVEDVSSLKRTALGDGYFVTTRRVYTDQEGHPVATMRFRVLKYRPRRSGPAPAPAWPRPAVNRDSAYFWAGTEARELRIQRCAACSRLRHPPSPACDGCGSLERDYVVCTGRGRIYSYVVHHHPPVPPFEVPFVVALVELDEGPRVVGNLLAEPAVAAVGLPVQVRFVAVADDLVLPQWEPVP